jgi:hypothetical protein
VSQLSFATLRELLLFGVLALFAGYPLCAADRPDNPSEPQSRRHERHNQQRFSQAYNLIQNGEYGKALVLLKQNIEETPDAPDIDYDYGWGILCLGKLCQFEEFVRFYEIMRTRYYGTSRVHDRGRIRDWDDKLMEAKKALFECPDVNSQAMVKRLMPIDDKAERTYKLYIEDLIHRGSMGNHRAVEELQLNGAALAEYIAKGDLILAKDAALLDTNFIPAPQTVVSVRKLGDRASLSLPPSMQSALDKFDSTFKACSLGDYSSVLKDWYPYSDDNLPFVVLGDFNGDSVKDAAIQGQTKSQGMIICILSTRTGFQVLPVDSGASCGDNGGLEIYLTHVGPGLIKTSFEENSLQLTTDAFNICYFEKASTLYYYKDGKFLQYTTSD